MSLCCEVISSFVIFAGLKTWQRCKIGGKLVLITNRKSYMSFDWYQNRWPWMTLNGVMAVALRYFTDCGKPAFQHITASISGGIYARVYCICSACTMSSQRTFTFAISSSDEFLVLSRVDLHNVYEWYYKYRYNKTLAVIDVSSLVHVQSTAFSI